MITTQVLQRWITNNPDLAQSINEGLAPVKALTHLGHQLIQKGQFADGLEVFHTLTEHVPENPSSWTNYGIALGQTKRHAEATICFEKSLALDKQQPITWLLLGQACQGSGDNVAAENAFRTAVEQQPRLATAWQCLGLLKAAQQQDEQAIVFIQKSLEYESKNPAVHANLGRLYYQNFQLNKALKAYNEAARLNPHSDHYARMVRKCRFLCDTLSGVSLEYSTARFWRSFLAPDPCAETELKEIYLAAFGMFSGFGHSDTAIRVGLKYLDRWPNSPSVRYLLQAMQADPSLERCPPGYIIEHFDAFAEVFDAKLVERLGYDVPGKICTALRTVMDSKPCHDVLDAGCGTGLCGPLLRPIAKSLVGIDLSPKMLKQAAKRGVYDRLECHELVDYLQHSQGMFDVVLAADVIIYFGTLTPVFAAATRALRPGGLLVFSTESQPEVGYRVQPTGRFAHSKAYILSEAQPHFFLVKCEDTTIRQHLDHRLPGTLYIFRRV